LSSDLRVAEQRIVKDTVSVNVAAIPPGYALVSRDMEHDPHPPRDPGLFNRIRQVTSPVLYSSLLQFRRDLKTALHVSVIVLFTIVSSCVTNCNF